MTKPLSRLVSEGWNWQACFGSVQNISIIWLVKVLGQDRPSAVHDKLNLEPNTLNRSNVLCGFQDCRYFRRDPEATKVPRQVKTLRDRPRTVLKKLHHSTKQDQTAQNRPSTAQHRTKTSPVKLTLQAKSIDDHLLMKGCRDVKPLLTRTQSQHSLQAGPERRENTRLSPDRPRPAPESPRQTENRLKAGPRHVKTIQDRPKTSQDRLNFEAPSSLTPLQKTVQQQKDTVQRPTEVNTELF